MSSVHVLDIFYNFMTFAVFTKFHYITIMQAIYS